MKYDTLEEKKKKKHNPPSQSCTNIIKLMY
jgi:hypothetical protein